MTGSQKVCGECECDGVCVCVCVCVCVREREMVGEERMGDKNLSKMHTVLWTSHISLSHLKSPNKISK